jgi:hypothetical protein
MRPDNWICLRENVSKIWGTCHSDKKELETILPSITTFLEQKLKLSLHPDKVFIKTIASGVDFLGWVYFSHHSVLRTSTKRRMMKNLLKKQKPESLDSYKAMLSHENTYNVEKKIHTIARNPPQ